MDLRIREAVVEDAPALAAYAARLFVEDLPGIFRRPVPTLEDEVTFIRQRVEPPNSTLLLAEAGGEAVGLIDCVGSSLTEERHVGTFGISVAKEWRGRGVGGALLDALVTWARTNGVTRIQGYVWATNPRALALYERHGFAAEGVCRKAVVRDGTAIDVTMIARLLDEDVSLRPLTDEDKAAAVALLDESMGRGFWGQESGLDGIVWAAVSGKTLVGVGAAHVSADAPPGLGLATPVGTIELVAVERSMRRRGIGADLVSVLVDECVRAGAKSLLSYAWVHGPHGRAPLAGTLERAGFDLRHRVEGFYGGATGETECPACGMRTCVCPADVFAKALAGGDER